MREQVMELRSNPLQRIPGVAVMLVLLCGAFSVLTGNLSAGTFFGPSQFPQMGLGESHLSASLS